MQFGEKLRKIRQERNLTQPDLAEQLGIEQSWLSKLENEKSLPSSDLLDRICQIFGLTLEQLLADLDPHYVRNQLASLPEVRGLLQEKRYTLVHNAHRWLLTATASLAVGVTLFVTGHMRWLFDEHRYIYESKGIVFKTEPEHLFDNPKDSLMPMAIADIEKAQESGELNNQYYRSKFNDLPELFFEKRRADLLQRNDSDIKSINEDRGEYYRTEATVPGDATDIYGNPISAGSPAFRIYTHESTIRVAQWQNKIFMVLGVLLTVTGFLLYFVEWRMARTTKGL